MAIVPREDLDKLALKHKNAVFKDWSHHRRLQALLRDHFPAQWDNISRCRMA